MGRGILPGVSTWRLGIFVAVFLGPVLAEAALAHDVGGEIAQAPSDGADAGDADEGIDAYFDDWFARVREAQASQPDWITPIATVTPRLEEEFRYDQYFEHLGNDADVKNYDSGKGLELIPTTTNEVLINLPPYIDRGIRKPASGFGDWPFLTIKQRLLSSPSDEGDYIVSAFFGVQAPTGVSAFTTDAWILTPTLAAGKGFGAFDIQATVGVPVPLSHESTIGTSIVSNTTLQYHVAKYFWPEFEVNLTHWDGGLRSGKTQVFLTPGIVFGRFPLGQGARAILGVGYQFAVSPALAKEPVLTPTYQQAWILSARVAF